MRAGHSVPHWCRQRHVRGLAETLVAIGDMDVDCIGPNCFLSDGSVGVLSTSNTSFAPAYGTATGWDFATGIGTVNAANLVNNWPTSTTQPGFLLSASPANLTILQGASGSTTISINAQCGFNGSVGLSASGLPTGVSAAFNPASTTGTSTLTLTATGTATTGTATVTITGSSGNLSSSTALSLTVNPPPNFTLSASPNSLTITQGASGASPITVNPLSGFNGSVSLSASGLPSGVMPSFSPASTTNTSTLTLTATSTATTGTVTVTVTGTSGTLTKATTVSLTIRVLPTLPFVWSDGDIGSAGVAGAAIYASGTFKIGRAGSGTMITSSDSFHFVYQPFAGDGSIVARVLSVQGSSAAQAGIMIRETLGTGANHVFLFDYSTSMLATERTANGASSSYQSVGSA